MKKKYGCKLQYTYEHVANTLGLPMQFMQSVDVFTDPQREIVTFKLRSEDRVSSRGIRTFEVNEGGEYPNQNMTLQMMGAIWLSALNEIKEKNPEIYEQMEEIISRGTFDKDAEAEYRKSLEKQEEK
jgi:hypothetical protein